MEDKEGGNVYSRGKKWLVLCSALMGICFSLTCGTDQTGLPSIGGSNPATRPTPGFGLISGVVDLNSENFEAGSTLELPASSNTPIQALHVNLNQTDVENGLGNVLVVVSNSAGDSFSTLTNDDGSFKVKARKEVASRLEFFENGEYLATLVFQLAPENAKATDTFLLDNAAEEMDLGQIAQSGQWAVPEVNPLSLFDDDNDGFSDFDDLDDDNDHILDVDEQDEDGDSFIDYFSEYYDETGALVVSFTMEGKSLTRDVELTDLDEITIIDSTIEGHVTITDSAYVFIDPTTISSLLITNCGEVVLEEVTVNEDLVLDEVENLQMVFTQVKGNTEIKNIAVGTVENSEFQGDFVADSASKIEEKGNKKAKEKEPLIDKDEKDKEEEIINEPVKDTPDNADKEKTDKEKIDKENADKEKIDKEKADKDKADKAKIDKENADKEKANKEKADKEKSDKENSDKEKADKEKIDKDKADKEKIDKEKADKEKADKEKADKEKVDKEKIDKENADKEKTDEADKSDKKDKSDKGEKKSK